MAERRTLWKVISQSRKVNKLSLKAALLYTWAIPWFDRDGYLEAEADYLKYNVFPRRDDIKLEDIQPLVNEIINLRLWEECVSDNGNRFIKEPKFKKMQKGMKYEREAKSTFNNGTPGQLPDNSGITPNERKLKEVKGS